MVLMKVTYLEELNVLLLCHKGCAYTQLRMWAGTGLVFPRYIAAVDE